MRKKKVEVREELFLVMKLLLKAVLMNIAVFLVISSWATVSSGWELPIGGGTRPIGDQLRLVSMDIPQSWTPSSDVKYWATVKFDTGFKPEIHRACFNFSGGKKSCVDVEAKDVSSGYFRVPIQVPAGTKRIDCYAEYIRNGETHRTNTVTYSVIILKKE